MAYEYKQLSIHRETPAFWRVTFDKPALAEAKRTLNRRALPDAEDLKASQTVFYKAFAWPGTQVRVRNLMELGIGTRSDLEMRFGDHLPGLAQERTVPGV